ncbi:hypothetical protein DENSPDRAFT_921132 [Dentipellis sp. KUC8613]|nr:hypothetical protein DENSPDRAFT_921132 [Dentipellis sp. KUC8613]
MKASHNAMVFAALLPCPQFLCRKSWRGILESRVLHKCLDIVCRPLKITASIGRMMADPAGYSRFCFTPLAAYIVDNPEAQMLAGVGAKDSAFTTAMYKQFGDAFPHPPRTASVTLAQLRALAQEAPDPWDMPVYVDKSKEHRLNGVPNPFWRDWPLSDPSMFLTPKPLHQWHKQCWDHDIMWCRHVLGDAELDFRYSVLQPRLGSRHFAEGISLLKQVTGREHRDIQRYLVGCIAGAAPPPFVSCVRALIDFRYLAQAPVIDDTIIVRLEACLKEFHEKKQRILDLGARRGKGKKKTIDNWYIPKLELMQSIPRKIRQMAAPIQWTADVTERSHIAFVKTPFRHSNRRDFDPQICCALDRVEKCHLFSLATSLSEALAGVPDDHDSEEDDDDTNSVDTSDTDSPDPSNVCDDFNKSRRPCPDYWNLISKGKHPGRIFATATTAFRLNFRPSHMRMTINEVSRLFSLPDLVPALQHYVHHCQNPDLFVPVIGGRRRNAQAQRQLPFTCIEIWPCVRIQTRSPYSSTGVVEPQNIQAQPPSPSWPYGRRDTVLVITDPTIPWPMRGIDGHVIAELHLIFRPLIESTTPLSMPYLTYASRFDFVSQPVSVNTGTGRHYSPDLNTGMYVVKKATRSDGSRMGDIIPLSQIRMPVHLIPRFGATADGCLNPQNSLACSTEFYVNKYVDKDAFAVIF